ncbi:hypothetical protein CXB51_004123 [Gossypium anomalum]|uniref:Uncharacterized protein n=1 Tax=Gossypium anomalum TaxID=47600 RepID=A0A8J5Z862_9ROSI|nr:hypothetical protein CXB51_004123 [Gossypium anomalum]
MASFLCKESRVSWWGFVVVKVLKLEEGSVSIGKDWLIAGGEGVVMSGDWRWWEGDGGCATRAMFNNLYVLLEWAVTHVITWEEFLLFSVCGKNMKLLHVRAFPIISFFLFLFCSACGELIKALPAQPAKQYSGYILTQPQHGRALFYYFVEDDSANPLAHPLTLRLDGGPGCSSLGFGAFMEDGPFQLGKHGRLIFMEYCPIRVGFSYSNTSSHYLVDINIIIYFKLVIFELGTDNQYFQPRTICNSFLIGSKNSHCIETKICIFLGKAMQLADLILNYNKRFSGSPIKLKAIAVNLSLPNCSLGNPLLDPDISVINHEFLWLHGDI